MARRADPERIYLARRAATFRRLVDDDHLGELDAEHWIAAWEREAEASGRQRRRSLLVRCVGLDHGAADWTQTMTEQPEENRATDQDQGTYDEPVGPPSRNTGRDVAVGCVAMVLAGVVAFLGFPTSFFSTCRVARPTRQSGRSASGSA
jgi:hypothetical protein